MNLKDLDQMLAPLGWRRLVSFDMTRVVITSITSRPVVVEALDVAALLTLAGVRWEKSHGSVSALVVYIPFSHEPLNP